MTSGAGSRLPAGDGWRLRAYREGDERWIVRRFERVFGRRMEEREWRWKFKERPSPAENVWLAVDGDDRPIFQYAAMPRDLRLPSGTHPVLVLVDLWTAPEHRRRGIFTACARWVHEHWRRAGVCGVLGAFNAREEPRYRRLGWEYLLPLRWQIRPLRPEEIAARRLGVEVVARWSWLGDAWNRAWDRGERGTSGGEIREEGWEGAEALGASMSDPSRIVLERGGSWLRWRYARHPRHRYRRMVARRGGRQVGHLVYRLAEAGARRFVFVAEVDALDPPAENGLIDAVVAHGRERGAVALATLAVPGSGLRRRWLRRGFVFSWGRFCIQWLPLGREPRVAQLRDRSAWALAGGDIDVI